MTKKQRRKSQYSTAGLEAADARLDAQDSDGCSEGVATGVRHANLKHRFSRVAY